MFLNSIVLGYVSQDSTGVPEELSADLITTDPSKDGPYILNTLTNQRIKLAPHVTSRSIPLEETYRDVNETEKFSVFHASYNFSDGNDDLFPTVNNLSFNPFIYEISDRMKRIQQDIIFFTALEEDFLILSYKTDMDVISVYRDRNSGKIGAILRYNRDRKSGNSLTLYGRYKKDKRFCKFTIKHEANAEDINVSLSFKLTKEEVTECIQLTKNRKGVSASFNYSARELPKIIICTKEEEEMMRKTVAEKENTKEESLVIVNVPEDFDWTDKNVAKASIGDSLKRSRAAIISPSISIPFPTARILGMDYLFKVFINDDGNTNISVVKRK